MQLNYTHNYPGSVEEVAQLMRTKEFIEDVATHAGANSFETNIEGAIAKLRMSLDSPSEVSTFIGKNIDVEQVMSWGEPEADGSRKGSFEVNIVGLPVKVSATGVLRPLGPDTCEAVYDGELKVKIPVVGKKVEEKAAPMADRAFAGIERRANAWLSGETS